jgi:hypothetical protein
MSTIDNIKLAIEALSPTDVILLREWILERDWQKWDRQIEADSQAGKLDFLIDEAREESGRSTSRDL